VLAAQDVDLINGLPTHKGGDKASQPQNVIEVTMREQNIIEALEANSRFEDLALGAFAAIDEEAIFFVLHHQCGQTPFDRWG